MRIPGIVLLPCLIPAWAAEPSPPAPPTPEMERILQDLKRGGQKWTAEANQKFAKDRDAAVAQMNKLIDAYTRKGDLEHALQAKALLEPIRASAISLRLEGIGLGKIRYLYRYEKKTYATGGMDYTDGKNDRLNDGAIADTYGNRSVGWRGADPSPIILDVQDIALIELVRVHVIGTVAGGGVGSPKEIRVLDQGGRLVGATKSIPDKTAWVEVPLRSVQGSVLTLEISRDPRYDWTIIDEIELE